MSKLWESGKKVDKKVLDFTVGNDYLMDNVLLPYDVLGSLAHAKMLEKQGLISKKELSDISKSLKKLKSEYDKGNISVSKDDEDVHTLIENFLTEELGETGKKIHAGRSRNDQVLTALRLYSKEQMEEIIQECKKLIKAFKGFNMKYGKTPLPGFTHTRKAMPSSVGLWASAFIESLEDDVKLLEFVSEFVDQSPLGTAAGYGAPIDTMRSFTAKELGFSKVQENPVYVQNSRGKFEILILDSLLQVMLDINKASSDLILFSMPSFGFFEIPDKFTTGSSIMPQKKNPDVLELLRGKYHVVLGESVKVKSMMGNLISGFHRDIQLSKESLVTSLSTTLECVQIFSLVVSGLQVDKDNCKKAMTDELFATEKVYELVKQGYTFRDAYKEIKKQL